MIASKKKQAKAKPADKPKAKAKPKPLDPLNVLYFALAKYGGNAGDRDNLAAGASYPVDLQVRGTAAGQEVDEAIAGQLTVGHNGSQKNTDTVDTVRLVAILLDQIGPRKRVALIERLEAHYLQDSDVPDPEDERSAPSAELLVATLSTTGRTPKRGPVAFVPDSATD